MPAAGDLDERMVLESCAVASRAAGAAMRAAAEAQDRVHRYLADQEIELRRLRHKNYESSDADAVEPRSCRHDSTRRDGDMALDDHCLRCGADGYWHDGHRHDRTHAVGKVLIVVGCPDTSEDSA